MSRLTDTQAYAYAAIGGALLWQVTAWVSGRREAWDSSMYWLLAYPAGLALAATLAYQHPVRPWRWALAMMWIQPVMMSVFSGSGFSMLPLGLIMFAFLALPPIAAASVAARRRLLTASQ